MASRQLPILLLPRPQHTLHLEYGLAPDHGVAVLVEGGGHDLSLVSPHGAVGAYDVGTEGVHYRVEVERLEEVSPAGTDCRDDFGGGAVEGYAAWGDGDESVAVEAFEGLKA